MGSPSVAVAAAGFAVGVGAVGASAAVMTMMIAALLAGFVWAFLVSASASFSPLFSFVVDPLEASLFADVADHALPRFFACRSAREHAESNSFPAFLVTFCCLSDRTLYLLGPRDLVIP